METTYVTKSGVELTLQAVPQMGIQSLLFGMLTDMEIPESGGTEQITEIIREQMKSTKSLETPKQVIRLINFVVSFGVKNEPTKEAVKVLRELGFETSPSVLAKKNWLMTQVLENDDVTEILGHVITLTFGNQNKG